MSNPVPVKSTPLVCAGHTRPIPSLHFSPLLQPTSPLSPTSAGSADPAYLLISSCKDGKPMLRDALGDWLGTFLGHKGAVWSSRLSSDGARAVTGSGDFTAKVWDSISGACLATLPHEHIVRTVDLSSNASHVLSGGNEKKLRLWDLARAPRDGTDADPRDGVEEFRMGAVGDKDGAAHRGTVRSACWDEKRGAVVSMGEDAVVRWWDLRTLQPTHEIKFSSPITSMEKSHDGELVSVTSGNDVTFLSLESRLPYLTHQLSYAPSTASLHPGHRATFVTGSVKDGWVRVHDAATGEEREVGKGHHGPVHCISYSPDGEMYASGSEDGTIRLWQTAPGITVYGDTTGTETEMGRVDLVNTRLGSADRANLRLVMRLDWTRESFPSLQANDNVTSLRLSALTVKFDLLAIVSVPFSPSALSTSSCSPSRFFFVSF